MPVSLLSVTNRISTLSKNNESMNNARSRWGLIQKKFRTKRAPVLFTSAALPTSRWKKVRNIFKVITKLPGTPSAATARVPKVKDPEDTSDTESVWSEIPDEDDVSQHPTERESSDLAGFLETNGYKQPEGLHPIDLKVDIRLFPDDHLTKVMDEAEAATEAAAELENSEPVEPTSDQDAISEAVSDTAGQPENSDALEPEEILDQDAISETVSEETESKNSEAESEEISDQDVISEAVSEEAESVNSDALEPEETSDLDAISEAVSEDAESENIPDDVSEDESETIPEAPTEEPEEIVPKIVPSVPEKAPEKPGTGIHRLKPIRKKRKVKRRAPRRAKERSVLQMTPAEKTTPFKPYSWRPSPTVRISERPAWNKYSKPKGLTTYWPTKQAYLNKPYLNYSK